MAPPRTLPNAVLSAGPEVAPSPLPGRWATHAAGAGLTETPPLLLAARNDSLRVVQRLRGTPLPNARRLPSGWRGGGCTASDSEFIRVLLGQLGLLFPFF